MCYVYLKGQPCSILVVPQSFSTSFSQERLPAEGSMQIVHTGVCYWEKHVCYINWYVPTN